MGNISPQLPNSLSPHLPIFPALSHIAGSFLRVGAGFVPAQAKAQDSRAYQSQEEMYSIMIDDFPRKEFSAPSTNYPIKP